MKKALIFGGGNIGRSFLTPVLQEASFHVTIADINESLINALRKEGRYPLVIRSREGEVRKIISGFDCLTLKEEPLLMERMLDADLVVSSVGMAGIQGVCSLLARALPERNRAGVRPLDLILAENIRNGAEFCRSELKGLLPSGYPLNDQLGLVETSIGKMVPLLTDQDRKEDSLRLFAEPYNNLILDRDAFLCEPPRSSSITLVSPIVPWVDRKLFIHNLGHAACAYLGREKFPERALIWEVLEDEVLRDQVRDVMREGAAALLAQYPGIFTEESLNEHIGDLISRFRNRALGDSVWRVGRDLRRKLGQDDRVVGAMRLAVSHGLGIEHLLGVYRAALQFGLDPQADPRDRELSLQTGRCSTAELFCRFSLGDDTVPDRLSRIILAGLQEED